MAAYTAYLPPDGRAEDARFIRDRFSLFAFLFPPFFLVWHRLWLALAAWLLAVVTLAVVGNAVSEGLAAALGFLPGLYLGVVGRDLVRARLERQGWREAGVVSAASLADVELRFFHAMSAAPVRKAPPPPARPLAPALPAPAAGSLGIFPQ
jgi:hypothetical protein